jgi:hypothetical protein
MEQNLPLLAAYDKYIEPRVKESDAKSLEDRIKREREEAVRDALSKHRLPVDPSPGESAPIWTAKAAQNGNSGVSDDELMATWNGAAKSQ